MIPLVLEESGGSERVFDIYSRLLRERIIFGEQATSETANSVAQLLFLEADPKDIYVYKFTRRICLRRFGDFGYYNMLNRIYIRFV